MKVYTKLGTMIAAVITGFNNGIVITADDLLDVGHDWLTMNTPQVGDPRPVSKTGRMVSM
jgi:hypothetical protein